MSTPLVADHAAQYRCYQACLGLLIPAIGLSTLLRHVLCVAKNWTVFDSCTVCLIFLIIGINQNKIDSEVCS